MDKVILVDMKDRGLFKHYCSGLWTNTYCSHLQAGKSVKEAAIRRLKEELDEFDHVLVGEYDGSWVMNPDEVDEVKWIRTEGILDDIPKNPEAYTPWFIVAIKEAVERERV